MSTLQHRFKYIKIGSFRRPIIKITLRNPQNKKQLDYIALVDSGADFNIFHGDLSYMLDIDLTKAKKIPISGISDGTAIEGYWVPLEIGLNGKFYPSMSVFCFEISLDGFGVLGQEGFFNNFLIQFNLSKNEILLKNP